jgi:hypothetical protein
MDGEALGRHGGGEADMDVLKEQAARIAAAIENP